MSDRADVFVSLANCDGRNAWRMRGLQIGDLPLRQIPKLLVFRNTVQEPAFLPCRRRATSKRCLERRRAELVFWRLEAG